MITIRSPFRLTRAAILGDFEIVGVVEDTAYTSATWKNHHMYFIPMTQRIPESARRRPIEQDTDLFAGAIVIQTDRLMDNMQSMKKVDKKGQEKVRKGQKVRKGRQTGRSPQSVMCQ